MKYKNPVQLPENSGAVTYKKIKETTYVYIEKGRTYDPGKGYTIPLRVCVGKLDGNGGIIPNEKFFTMFPEQRPELDRCPTLNAGTYAVFSKLIRSYRLDEMLSGTVGAEYTGLFLDLALYYIVCEDNASQHFPAYAMSHPLFSAGMHVYSDSTIGRALGKFGEPGLAYRFLCKWNESRDRNEKVWVSYDSTNKGSAGERIGVLEYGNAKVDDGNPIFNWSVAYDASNSEPLFYEEYLGSVVDVSQLELMLDKADSFGYRNIGFILDRGYFSKDNLRFMDEHRYPFLIMTKGFNPIIRSYIDAVRGTFETSRDCCISGYGTYGIKVRGRLHEGDCEDRSIFIYFKAEKCAFERRLVEKKVERISAELAKLKGKPAANLPAEVSRLFEIATDKKGCLVSFREKTDVVRQLLDRCGYYAIASSEDMTATEALLIYKGRDCEEKLFRMDKTFLGCNAMRSYSDESVAGRLFVEFVALILRSRYYRSLKLRFHENASTPDWATVPASIGKLEQIWMSRQADGVYRQDAAITRTQKEILGAFGISEADMKKTIADISQVLKGGSDNGKKEVH